MQVSGQLALDRFLADVVRIKRDAGGVTSAAFDATLAAWEGAKHDPTDDQRRASVIEAIASGDTEAAQSAMDRAAFEAAAVGARSNMRQRIATDVHRLLVQRYRDTAKDNYVTAAARYDEIATRLSDASAVLGGDFDSHADQIVGMDDQARSAWTDSQAAAAQIDDAFDVLVLAAELAGMRPTMVVGTPSDSWKLALCCDPGDADDELDERRRRVWAAFRGEVTHRCGRWGALIAEGVTLRAADAHGYTYFREARPLVSRTVRVPVGAGAYGARQVLADVNDPRYQTSDAKVRRVSYR